MDLTQKIDALDLIINVLKEHEKELDRLIIEMARILDRNMDRQRELDAIIRYNEAI